MQCHVEINARRELEKPTGLIKSVLSCDLPHEIVRNIVFESLLGGLDSHLHISLQSYRPVCRKWNAAAESAAILYANSLGSDGLQLMCRRAHMNSMQLASLIMRRGGEIARFSTETEMQFSYRSNYFEATVFVRPALELLDLGALAHVLHSDYTVIIKHLPKLKHLVVDQSFGDAALQLVTQGLQKLRILDLGAAGGLTEKGFSHLASASMPLRALLLPLSKKRSFPLNFFSSFRPQSEIDRLHGSFTQLQCLSIVNYALTHVTGLCRNFPFLTALRLANCRLKERDLLVIHRYYPHLDTLDISLNPAVQHGIITLVCTRSKETDIVARGSVTDKNLERLCHQLKLEYPKFKF